MYKFDKLIRMFNFVFTDTIDGDKLLRNVYDLNYRRVHYKDCISLKEILDTFIFLHNSFKEDYEKLDKIDLGEEIEFDYYSPYEENNDNYRCLMVYLKRPNIIDKPSTLLYMQEVHDELRTFVTEDDIDEDEYIEYVNLDNEKVKGYLDFFDKYYPLFTFYKLVTCSSLHNDDACSLFWLLRSPNNNILDDINSISIYISLNPYMISGNSIDIYYDLINNKINLNLSSAVINKKRYKLNEEEFNNILERIYINKNHLNRREIFDGLEELKEQIENKDAKQKRL